MRSAIALNRFGLGARTSDRISGDPRGWLLGQLDSFQVRPPAIANVESPDEFFANFDAYRAARKANNVRKAERQEAMGRDGSDETRMAGGAEEAMEEPMGREGGGRRRGRERGEGTISSDDLRTLPIELARSAVQARLQTAVTTDTPFVERLVHFWSNHFAISADTVSLASVAGDFEFEAIRPNVLGKFADMVAAVELHPAMLAYLNQSASIGPNSRRGRPRSENSERARGLNENLAREILELHTLGVRSGYTEEDVRELARAMTGRTVAGRGVGRRAEGAVPGEAVFVEAIHEPGARTLLGRTFPDTGEEQAAAMIDYVARRPETARHIATKLARHFIADEPPASAVARLERAFVDSDGDLPTVYRAVVNSPEAWREPFAKFKTPWDWMVSAWRASGTEAELGRTKQILDTLGQPIWRPESPAGYGDLSSDWAAPDALMRRVEMAQELVRRIPSPAQPAALGQAVLPEVLSAETRTAISRADSAAQGMTMLLVAPEFLRR